MAAIETHSLRKVYPAPPAPKWRKGGGMPVGAAGRTAFAGPPPGGRPSAGARMSGSGTWAAGGKPGPVEALKGLDLEVHDGEFFGLLGPNGAGKTTTIGILTTRVKPTSGTALVGGANVASQAVQVRQRIGVVPQRPNPDRSLNALENLLYHAVLRDWRIRGDAPRERAARAARHCRQGGRQGGRDVGRAATAIDD